MGVDGPIDGNRIRTEISLHQGHNLAPLTNIGLYRYERIHNLDDVIQSVGW